MIAVYSEIGPLQQVLLHRPGKELEHLVPGELERLLFDDIPFLKTAQQEHDAFAHLLEEQGAQVLYLEDLVAQTLQAHPELKESFLRRFIDDAGERAKAYRGEILEYLLSISDPKDLVLKTMSGISSQEIYLKSKRPLTDLIRSKENFILDPIPNLYFTRDPFACVGNGVCLHHMYSHTRQRETIYGDLIFNYHPDYAGRIPRYYNRDDSYHIEGGDILNLTAETLAIGISQRTMSEAVEKLCGRLFFHETCQVRRVLALTIPNTRAFMHLDTVCTQVDVDKFLVHPEIMEGLDIYELTPGTEAQPIHVRQRTESLDRVLAEVMGVDQVTLIQCGGDNQVASMREQWNDGSNTLCVRPGAVVTYDRNYITNEILSNNGIEVLEIPSSELSRGRGGPRCMSMPFIRKPIQ